MHTPGEVTLAHMQMVKVPNMIYKLLPAAGCVFLAHIYSGRLDNFSASSSHLSDCSAETLQSLGMEMNMPTAKPGWGISMVIIIVNKN